MDGMVFGVKVGVITIGIIESFSSVNKAVGIDSIVFVRLVVVVTIVVIADVIDSVGEGVDMLVAVGEL